MHFISGSNQNRFSQEYWIATSLTLLAMTEKFAVGIASICEAIQNDLEFRQGRANFCYCNCTCAGRDEADG